jgi:hypothetical protein
MIDCVFWRLRPSEPRSVELPPGLLNPYQLRTQKTPKLTQAVATDNLKRISHTSDTATPYA